MNREEAKEHLIETENCPEWKEPGHPFNRIANFMYAYGKSEGLLRRYEYEQESYQRGQDDGYHEAANDAIRYKMDAERFRLVLEEIAATPDTDISYGAWSDDFKKLRSKAKEALGL